MNLKRQYSLVWSALSEGFLILNLEDQKDSQVDYLVFLILLFWQIVLGLLWGILDIFPKTPFCNLIHSLHYQSDLHHIFLGVSERLRNLRIECILLLYVLVLFFDVLKEI